MYKYTLKILLICLLLFLVAAAQPVLGSDWAQFQKDIHNTGVTADRAPITDPTNCSLSWNYSMGGNIDVTPVVAGDMTYVVASNNHLYAFNRTTGTLLWEQSTSGGGFLLGNLAVGNGIVFVPTVNGQIFAFDAETGSPKWNKTLSSKQLDTPILYSDGKIYFGEAMGGRKYYCLDEDGNEVWNRTSTTQISGQGSYYWAGAAVIGDSLVYGDDDGHLVSVNKDTGTDIAEINVSEEFGVNCKEIRSSVLYIEELNRIYFTSKGGYCYALSFNVADGTFNTSDKYSAYIGYSTSTPAYYNGRIYVGAGGMYGGGSGISCLDADLTDEIWHYAAGAVQSSPAISTYYDDGDGEVYVYFTVNSATGGVFCLKDYAGCTDPELAWSYADASKTAYTLAGAIISDGWIYYGTDKRYLFGFTTEEEQSPKPPVADFTATPISGDSPLTVNFTDASTGSVSSYSWDFDNDGTVDSTEQNPVHIYSTEGTYTVNLTVSNAGGSDSEVKTGYISVSEPLPSAPVAGFSADITSGVGPLTVQFTDSSTGSPDTWEWDFDNDGDVDSTEQNPKFIYTDEGRHSVKLTVTNSAGSDSELKIDYITVIYPSPDFTANVTEGTVPLTVEFTGNVSGLAPGYWNMWAWDVNGDGIYDYSPNSNITHTYIEPGTYDVIVAYDGWTPKVKADYITVLPPVPVANFSADVTSGNAPLTVNFIDQSTGTVSSYSWDFNNDSIVDSTEQNPSHTYSEAGNYTVNLTVVNAGGSDSEVKPGYIVVSEPVPEAPVANFTASPTAGDVPLTVNFTDQSTGTVSSYSWDFDNDGTVDSTEQNPSYTYESAGNYTVSFMVSNAGGSDSEVKTDYIAVSSIPVEPEPVAAFIADITNGTVPLAVNFTDQSTGTPTSWFWDFGDGANSTEQNPSHTYTSAGTYTVNLTVENAAGMDFELKTDYIEVSEDSGSTVTLYFDPSNSSVNKKESVEISILASNFPEGFSGYNLTVAIDDPTVAEIVDIKYPSWALITGNSTLPGTSIYLKTVDLEDAVKAGAADVVLATLTVSGKESGSANLSIGVKRLEDDSEDAIEPIFLTGKIEVTILSPLPGEDFAPQDLDGDGLYEDLTGNGEFSFVDIVAYFHNMDWIEENMPVEYFDFNGNGRIDFDDVVCMFAMI